ncbi:MAG: hypothetical protein K0T01_807, partial [Acidimicrobiia bacterium]|nr:hypothetical protein [Acidimicrobiia bacterium]
KSVVFPSISTGVYLFPKPLAARTAVAAVTDWVVLEPAAIDMVLFVCFGRTDLDLYRELLPTE